MPTPQPNESRDEFIERCIPMVIEEGTANDEEQAYAVCESYWEEAEGDNDMQNLQCYREMTARIKSQFPVIKGKKEYKINAAIWNAEKAEQMNEVLLYDEIGWFGVTAEQFKKDIKALTGDITLRVNSPGGDVFDGMAMYNTLKQYDKGKVTAYIDGLAASAAGVAVLAADEIKAPETATLMLHEAWGGIVGNKREMRKFADELDKIDGQIMSVVRNKSKKGEDETLAAFNDELWMTGSEGVEWGFIDELIEYEKEEKNNKSEMPIFDLSAFSNTPETLKQPSEACETQEDGGTPPKPRTAEDALRDVGYSRREAKAILSDGLKAIKGQQEDVESAPEGEGQPNVVALFRQRDDDYCETELQLLGY